MVTAVSARPRSVVLLLSLLLGLAGFSAIPVVQHDRVGTALGVRGGPHASLDEPPQTPGDGVGVSASGSGSGSADTSLNLGVTSTTPARDTLNVPHIDDDGPGLVSDPTSSTTAAPTTQPRRQFTGPAVDSVAYQLNAAHTGGHIDPDLPSRLDLLWKRDLNASMSYPLIVADRIFAVGAPYSDADGDNAPIRLYAFDRRTGIDAWPSVEIGGGRLGAPVTQQFTAGLAYDAGRIYVANYDGVVRAFAPDTGRQLWSTTLPGIDPSGGNGVTSMPTAKDGHVYVVSPSKVFAVAESDGQLIWTAAVAGGGVKTSPAVSSDGVYVSVGAIDVYKFSPLDGTQLWHMHSGENSVIGGTTPVLYDGKLYVRLGVPGFTPSGYLSFPGDGRVLDAATGAQQSSTAAVFTPAFRAGVGVFIDDARVVTGRDLAADAVLWTYPEDATAPLVVNDDVFLQTTDGRLVRVDRRSGDVLYMSDPGLVDAWPNENAPQWMQHGLAEGRGVVAATHGHGLSVFG